MNNCAPILIFAYNRVDKLEKLILSLSTNELSKDSEIYIFCDKEIGLQDSKNVKEVKDFILSFNFKSYFNNYKIHFNTHHFGLAKSIITGVTQILKNYDRVIVLEDDLIISKYFLRFMNDALNYFLHDDRIFSISGFTKNFKFSKNYPYDIYLFPRGSSWGWATWKNRWNKVLWNHENIKQLIKNKNFFNGFNLGGPDLKKMLIAQLRGKIDSWAIRWVFSQYINKQFTIYPTKSLVLNDGTDGTGTHKVKFRIINKIDNDFLPNLSYIMPNKTIIRTVKNSYRNSISDYLNFINAFIRKIFNL